MVEWFRWDSSLISTTNWIPSVLWHCWFGHLAKNHPEMTYYVSSGTLNPTHSLSPYFSSIYSCGIRNAACMLHMSLCLKKHIKFATKSVWHYPPHLRYVATLPWEIKNSNFLQIFSRYGRKCKYIAFKCTDFNSCMRITMYAECIYAFLSKSCPCRWVPFWLLTNTAAMSAVTNFRCHRLIAKVNKWHEKFYL